MARQDPPRRTLRVDDEPPEATDAELRVIAHQLGDRAAVLTRTGRHRGHTITRRGHRVRCSCGTRAYDHPPRPPVADFLGLTTDTSPAAARARAWREARQACATERDDAVSAHWRHRAGPAGPEMGDLPPAPPW